jgi:hypothetical protein
LIDAAVGPVRFGNTRVGAWLAKRKEILAWWAGSRLLVLGTALVVHWLRMPRGYFGRAVFNRPFGILEAWDGRWYRMVAEHGYMLVPHLQSDPAFFPLYPLALKVLSHTGLSLGTAGLLLSNACFLAALLAFDALGREVVGGDVARRATMLLAVFPLSYVCSMIYPESLLLLSTSLAVLFALRRRWIACMVATAIAALVRPEGAFVLLPIAAIVIHRWKVLDAPERGRAVGAMLTAPAAVIAYPIYLGWSLRDPLAWTKAQEAWGRAFQPFGGVLAIRRLPHEFATQVWPYRDLAACLILVALLAVARRRGVPLAWVVAGLVLVLLPLESGSFQSDARFGFAALAVYWGLASLCDRGWRFRAAMTACVGLLVAATATIPLAFP